MMDVGYSPKQVLEALREYDINITQRTLQRYVEQGLLDAPIKVGRSVFYSTSVEKQILRLPQHSLRYANARLRAEVLKWQDKTLAKAEEIARLEAALERVRSLGHNLDCMFCGFKDKQVDLALKEDE